MQVMLEVGKELLTDLLITMDCNYFTGCVSETLMQLCGRRQIVWTASSRNPSSVSV